MTKDDRIGFIVGMLILLGLVAASMYYAGTQAKKVSPAPTSITPTPQQTTGTGVRDEGTEASPTLTPTPTPKPISPTPSPSSEPTPTVRLNVTLRVMPGEVFQALPTATPTPKYLRSIYPSIQKIEP